MIPNKKSSILLVLKIKEGLKNALERYKND